MGMRSRRRKFRANAKINAGPRAFYSRTLIASTAFAAAGTFAAAGPIAAAESVEAAPVATETLEEIIVSAQKYRATDQTSATGLQLDLIDTPQSISVLTPVMLQVAGAPSIYQATDLVPGLRRSGTGFGLDRFVMRGNLLTTNRINGTSFQAWHSLEGYAINRFEIVRGPATALYGVTGSFGGEINQILKSPGKSFGAEIGYRGGDFDLHEFQLDVTGPIPSTGDKLSGRLVALGRDSGVYVNKDIVDDHDKKYMVMGSLQYDFTDTTSSHLWIYYDSAKADPMDGGALQLLPNGTLTFPNVPPDDWYWGDPRYNRNTISNMFVVADVEHELANSWRFKAQATLTKTINNMSEYYVYGPAGGYALADHDVYLYTYDQYQTHEDATFDMSLGGKFNVGGREQQFFAAFEGQGDVRPTTNTLYHSLFLGTINIDRGYRGVFSDGSPVPLIDKSTLTVNRLIDSGFRDYRESVQFLIDPIDRLKVLVGVLAQQTKQTSTVTKTAPVNSETSFTKVVKRLGIVYDLMGKHGAMDATKAYFNYSEGFNPNIGVKDGDGNPLNTPQEMTAYEVGIKSEFLNGAAGSSLALYDSTIDNIPVQNNYLGGFGSAGSVLEGRRKVKGVEFEFVGEIVRGWNVALNYAFTNSEISDPNYTFTIPVKSTPKNAAALYTSYEFVAGPLRGLRFGGDVAYSSDYSFNPSLGNTKKWGNYFGGGGSRVDLNLAYRFETGPFEGLELYANAVNIFDKVTYLSKEDSPAFGITRDLPRQYTFTVRYVFK